MFTLPHVESKVKPERESIHSGQFMVSHFEAEEQDDEDEVAVPVPEDNDTKTIVPVRQLSVGARDVVQIQNTQQHLEIDTSLSKLFQCMTLAYRQKLTSPKWNRFRGIRLRWKEKIRLNNVIWRCWHMQFIKKQNTLICQFASPLDVDTHNKPEAVVLEGKYWKRKLHAVTAEYKKWRLFYRHHLSGHLRDQLEMPRGLDNFTWNSQSPLNDHMLVDEDYMGLMSDTLFSTLGNQPFPFPDTREIAKAGLADFIQPSLEPLQPNLDDYMDTFEPLHEFIIGKLPTVPEEQSDMYKPLQNWYSDMDLMGNTSNIQMNSTQLVSQYNQMQPQDQQVSLQQNTQDMMQPATYHTEVMLTQYGKSQIPAPPPPPDIYTSSSLSKRKPAKSPSSPQVNYNSMSQFSKSLENVYQTYQTGGDMQVLVNDRILVPLNQQPQVQNQMQGQSNNASVNVQNMPSFVTRINTDKAAQEYKFAAPASRPNTKFTSQVSQQLMSHSSFYNASFSPKEENREQTHARGARGRPRSRSNTREPVKRPPLISASSDPALITPSNSLLLSQLLTANNVGETTATIITPHNSVLTQLLTNNVSDSTNIYKRNQVVGKSNDSITNQVRIKEENPLTILAQPTTTSLIITPVNLNNVQTPVSEPLLLNTYSSSNSPVLETSQSLNSPTSSQGSIGSPNRENSGQRDRRVGHIHAEQKRRYNIKNGFDMIHSLIPHLNQNPNAKLSKAALLQKGADYIRQLRNEREQLKKEMEDLRQQIDTLNTSISNCQSMLPATVAPINIRRDGKMQELFEEYVQNRTRENWRYWIFSLIFKPLLASFNNVVSTASLDELYRSTMLWVEQHCTLGDLRPVVTNSLRYLGTKTEILSKPEKLPEEALKLSMSKH